MSCVLTSGRTEPCRDNVGGIKNLYIAKWQKYSHTQMIGQRGVELLNFPTDTFFKIFISGGTFNEEIVNDENGIYYDQSLNFTMTGDFAVKDYLILNEWKKVDVRMIVEYNNGNFRMMGQWNGTRLTNYSKQSGGGKSDFSGYNLTFTAREQYQAPFMSELEIPDIELGEIFYFEDKNLFLFQDGLTFIFQ